MAILTYDEANSLDEMTRNNKPFTRLKALRLKKGISQQDLATYVHISLRTYQSYERGDKLPRIDVAIRLSRILGKAVEFIWSGQGMKKDNGSSNYFDL